MTADRTNHHRPEANLPNLPDWEDQQDQFDRLNDLWDSLATGSQPRRRARIWNPLRVARTRPSETDAEAQARTIRALDRADDTPDPDSQFLRDLRSTLMDTSHAVPIGVFDQSPQLPSAGGFAPPRNVTPIRPGILKRFSGSSMRILELAAVAALLLTMIGFAAGDRGIQDIRALLPAGQNDAELDSAAYLGNAAHTGEMPGPGPEAPVGLLWRTPAVSAYPNETGSSPVVADGVLYFTIPRSEGTSGDTITEMVAIDINTGQPLWEVPLPGFLAGAPEGTPVVADGVVYVGVSLERWLGGPPATPEAGATPEVAAYMAGAVIALDAQTGQELWAFDELPKAGVSSPVVTDGTLYIVAEDGTLYVIDAGSGRLNWTALPTPDPSSPYPEGFATAPTVAGDTIYIPTLQGNLLALDSSDGSERWSAPINHFLPTVAVVSGDTVLIGMDANGAIGSGPVDERATPEIDPAGENVFAFDAETGAQRWALDTTGFIGGAPTVAGDLVLVTGEGEANTDVVARSLADGSELWRTSTGDDILTPAVWSGETAYVGSSDSKLYALDLATGTIQWQVATGATILNTPVVADGIVAFPSFDGQLYAVANTPPNGATPTASGEQAIDISGMPTCTIAPRADYNALATDGVVLAPEGAPTTESVRPDYDVEEMPSPQTMLFADLPSGEAAPPVVENAIRATIAEMAPCNRPGYEARLAAYYSDDYFRRDPIVAPVGHFGATPLYVPAYYSDTFASATTLPDGRVAVLYTYEAQTPAAPDGDAGPDHGYLVVWVQIDGRWVIDESIEVSEGPGRG